MLYKPKLYSVPSVVSLHLDSVWSQFDAMYAVQNEHRLGYAYKKNYKNFLFHLVRFGRISIPSAAPRDVADSL